MFSVLLWLLRTPRILSFPWSIFPGRKLNGLSPSARLKEVTGKGRRAVPWRKADLGSADQGQRESEVERMKEQEQPSGRIRGGFAGAHVLRRGSVSAVAKCPPPQAPPTWGSGVRANGRGPCGAWPAHRCRPGPPVPSPPPLYVRLGGGPGLRSLRLPPHLRLPAPTILQPGTRRDRQPIARCLRKREEMELNHPQSLEDLAPH